MPAISQPTNDLKPCPYCAKPVAAGALVCPFCRLSLPASLLERTVATRLPADASPWPAGTLPPASAPLPAQAAQPQTAAKKPKGYWARVTFDVIAYSLAVMLIVGERADILLVVAFYIPFAVALLIRPLVGLIARGSGKPHA